MIGQGNSYLSTPIKFLRNLAVAIDRGLSISADDVKQLAYRLGANLCGIAPVERFQHAPRGFHPCDVLPECRSVIVLGATWPESSLEQGSAVYTMARDLMADKLDLMAKALALELQGKGAVATALCCPHQPARSSPASASAGPDNA